jgi:blue copper oxidase
MSIERAPLDRRRFVRLSATGGGLLLMGGLASLSGCDSDVPIAKEGDARAPLQFPPHASPFGLALVAAAGTARVGAGEYLPAWLYNGSHPGPTIEARRGDAVAIRFLNQLTEPSIVHWHGLIVPEAADGHPRYAIDPGESFDYAFPLVQRAGTYWYHPHAHHLTGGQVHRGLAGLFIVRDAEEDALQLPSGSREVSLVLQDRSAGADAFVYAPSTTAAHTGLLGNVPFINGTRQPELAVSADVYRFRVLNASQARVYRLALSNDAPLTVIGNDGGLLPMAVDVDSIFLGVGERVDILVDFSAVPLGQRLMLKSLPFDLAVAQNSPYPQGMEMDLLALTVRTPGQSPGWARPGSLSSIPALAAPVTQQAFSFTSPAGSVHRINDQAFDMDRVDAQIPLGQVEMWTFRNDSELPHPIHLHGTHFQVVSRQGGRNAVYAWETGWKDTVLVLPLERVVVLVRFDLYRGIFPLHCHNLQHEDMGMMLNVEVV